MGNAGGDPGGSADGFSPARLREALARHPPMPRYRVAFSGGADSLALLHALAASREALAPARIDAIHVHHGLHPEADAWADACGAACAGLGLDLEVVRVDARPGPGESPEAAARAARYRAMAERLGAGEAVCTGHHRRDQAETLLLQLLRGAGPAGLAGMPSRAPLGAGWLLRPLLDTSSAALRDYLGARGIDWIEDPGNADPRFDRSFLRHEIMPRLAARWPGVERTLARAAAHQADSAAMAEALARLDLETAGDPATGTLSCAAVAALPAPRARHLLRSWLAARGLPAPGAAHLEQVLAGLSAREDATPVVSWPGAEVRRHRDRLHALAPLPAHPAERVFDWRPGEALALPFGRLEATPARGHGLSAARLRDAHRVEVRFRRGGERFRPAGRRHATTLKKLLQASDVPPWLRERIPLVYVDGELAAVAGMWVAEGHAAGGAGSGWVVRWNELATETNACGGGS